MTELEIAKQTRTCLYWMRKSDKSYSGLDVTGLYNLWESRVKTLEAVEQLPWPGERIDEPGDPPTESEAQADIDRVRLNALDSHLAKLRLEYDYHCHEGWRNGPNVGTTTGPRHA